MFFGSRIDVTSRPSVGIVHNRQIRKTDSRRGTLRMNAGRQADTPAFVYSMDWTSAVMLPPTVVESSGG